MKCCKWYSQYEKVTDEKCLQLQKVSLTHPHTNRHARTSAPSPPSLSTASAPYQSRGVWRASGWPAPMCVWPQWSQIREGYGKHRLKHWIMEKLIWSMDQQGTQGTQHTHKHAYKLSQNLFTKPKPSVKTRLLVISVTTRYPHFNGR